MIRIGGVELIVVFDERQNEAILALCKGRQKLE
jgi:hypothetical protein